jgi:hypothetical protein
MIYHPEQIAVNVQECPNVLFGGHGQGGFLLGNIGIKIADVVGDGRFSGGTDEENNISGGPECDPLIVLRDSVSHLPGEVSGRWAVHAGIPSRRVQGQC